MASETFRLHLHESGVQFTLSPADHLALRVTVSPDTTWPVGGGVDLEGSYDNLSWATVLSVTDTAVGTYVVSAHDFLRVKGTGSGISSSLNATMTVEYLEELVASGTTETLAVGLALRLDDVGTGVTYVGEADPGTINSASEWRIKKLVETGSDLDITWADGSDSFNQVWDDRLALSYS